MSRSETELLEEIRQFDTPSVTNVVATYPQHPLCLGLYNPLSESWYTDHTIRCMYPELGALAGYAVTAVYGPSDPDFKRLSFMDVIDALDTSLKPTIFCFQQKFPPELAGKIGLAGGNMTTAMKAIGCVGAISNGPSRDIDEIRPMKFQYLLSGITPGHGSQDVHAVNVPVHIAGMDVAPGEIVHMDENGAVKFSARHLEQVVTNLHALREEEEARMSKLAKAKTAMEVRGIFGGHGYGVHDDGE
ncbi:MAG: RraA family protein [Candidatus Latescibacterota bacterium]|nr:RraA family protein [Candidatus Latescibacterota bacterium]